MDIVEDSRIYEYDAKITDFLYKISKDIKTDIEIDNTLDLVFDFVDDLLCIDVKLGDLFLEKAIDFIESIDVNILVGILTITNGCKKYLINYNKILNIIKEHLLLKYDEEETYSILIGF